MVGEEWRPLSGTIGYEVSSRGRVRRQGRILKLRLSRAGYPTLSISRLEGRRQTRVVHALVMEAFVGPRPEGMVIAHRDGDRANNALANIRYCTPQENRADDILNGTRRRGSQHGMAKLTEEAVREIKSLLSAGVLSKTIAKSFGVTPVDISHIKRGKTWTHV